MALTIDYRCENRRKLTNEEETLVPLDGLNSPFQQTQIISPKNEPLSQEMHSKIPLLSRGLKLSNPIPGCRVFVLHFVAK
jgi:hypothetical protein